MTKQTREEILAEFDREFGGWLCNGKDEFGHLKHEEGYSILLIRQFVRQKIDLLEKSIKEEVVEWVDNREVMGIGGNFGEGYERGYKNALQDLKSYLTTER